MEIIGLTPRFGTYNKQRPRGKYNKQTPQGKYNKQTSWENIINKHFNIIIEMSFENLGLGLEMNSLFLPRGKLIN